MVVFNFNTYLAEDYERGAEERDAMFTEREQQMLGHRDYSSLNYVYPVNSIQRDRPDEMIYLNEHLIRDGRRYGLNPDRYFYQVWRRDHDCGNELFTMNAYALYYLDYFLTLDERLGCNPYEALFILCQIVRQYDNPPTQCVKYQEQFQNR